MPPLYFLILWRHKRMIEVRNTGMAIAAAASGPTLVSEAQIGGRGKRVALEISNLNAAGGEDCFFSIDQEAAVNQGRKCAAGQTISWSSDVRPIPQGRIWGISTSGNNITIYEEIEQ